MYPTIEEKTKEVIYIGADIEVLIHKPYKEKFRKDEKVKKKMCRKALTSIFSGFPL